ncbi:MAG: hypothetical protein U9O82_08955 [Thermodesulfobacteriota bacterium]|nr:hypothetical protein [Thermodesulfobacteriota bacterium]
MTTNPIKDIRMPYEFEVSKAAYKVLSAVGNAVAAENDLKKHYEGTYHTYGAHGSGSENLPHRIKAQAAKLGIHAKFEADLILGYKCAHYRLTRVEKVSGEIGRVLRYRVDVKDYGCLPQNLTTNIDRLAKASGVKAAVNEAGTAQILYELIDSFAKYNARKGRTVDIFNLKSEETYTELNRILTFQVAARRQEIDNSFVNKVPGIRQIYRYLTEKALKERHTRKQTLIDALQTRYMVTVHQG